MKRYFKLASPFIILWVFVAVGWAMMVKYNQPLVNEAGLAYNNTYPLSLAKNGIDNISFTTVCSSVTYSADTFTDGQVSTATITVSSSPAAGVPGLTLCINSGCISDGLQFAHDTVGIASNTALSIFNAMTVSTSPFYNVIKSSLPAGGTVIYTTATTVGMNYSLWTSSQSALTIAPYTSSSTTQGWASGSMVGGVSASFTINSPIINLASHGYTKGLEVLYTSSTYTIAPLVSGTTYYVIPLTANSLELATTSTGAVAGSPITITSSNTLTAKDTFTLAPLAITGTPSYKWQVSEDGITWSDYLTTPYGVSVSSITIGSYISTGTVNTWDFPSIDYPWISLNVVAPTTGGIKLTAYGNGKGTIQ